MAVTTKDIFMNDKIYHIYLKDRCVYNNLTKEKFEEYWKNLNYLTEFLGTPHYTTDDLSYEELTVNKKAATESSY